MIKKELGKKKEGEIRDWLFNHRPKARGESHLLRP